MSAFFYYIPGRNFQAEIVKGDSLNLEFLKSRGLGHVFHSALRAGSETIVSSSDGPDGNGGVVLHPVGAGELKDVTYSPRGQAWFETDEFWLGCMKDDPPKAADLQHTEKAVGYELAWQNDTWFAPVIRSPENDRTSLPENIAIDPKTLEVISKRNEEQQELWELAGRCGDFFSGKGDIPAPERFAAAMKFLQMNYRIGPAEAMALKEMGVDLLDAEFYMSVIASAVDLGMWEEYQESLKKKVIPVNANRSASSLQSA